MEHKGLSVIIRNESEFNRLKYFLGDYLYLNFVPQMSDIKTAVVIHYDNDEIFSIGHVGDANYHEIKGCRLVEFKDFFLDQNDK